MLAETLIYPTGCHTNKYYRDKLVVNRPFFFVTPQSSSISFGHSIFFSETGIKQVDLII